MHKNEFLKTLTSLDENLFIKHKGEIKETTENLKNDGIKYTKINEEEEAKIIYEFEIEQSEETYMYLLGINLDRIIIKLNEKEIGSSFSGYSNKMIPLNKYNVRR